MQFVVLEVVLQVKSAIEVINCKMVCLQSMQLNCIVFVFAVTREASEQLCRGSDYFEKNSFGG